MTKAYMYLRKIVALTITVTIFIILYRYNFPIYISIPILTLTFSIIVSKITGSSPKELFNFQRSEKFFNKGGLRDLIRIPVVLFAFVQDVIVWAIWGIYQVFVLFTDTVYFIKELVFWILHAIIWFLKQLLPFWRIVYKMVLHYLIKWPWWIYKYAFRTIRKTYNWNILKISLTGTFITLFTFQAFYFLDVNFDMRGVVYIGVILALLPLSWVFGEISSIRGQKLMHVSYKDVKKRFRNGIESVRDILVFIALFVVLLLAEAGLDALGLIPNAGIIFLGITLNISFVINIMLLFLVVLIVFGTFVLPTYRLYNDFDQPNLKNIYKLFRHICRRSIQYVSGLIPATFFGAISSIPALIAVLIVLFLTIQGKDGLINIKIEKLYKEQAITTEQQNEYRIRKEISHLQYTKQFPLQILQEVEHRSLLEDELRGYKRDLEENEQVLQEHINSENTKLKVLSDSIKKEKQKQVLNVTRIEELEKKQSQTQSELNQFKQNKNIEISNNNIDIEFAHRKLKQLPWVFYLSGFFMVVASTLIFTIFFGYLGNFFYKSYLYRNDGTKAHWKTFISAEKEENKNQPLLSTTLNIIVFAVFTYFILDKAFTGIFIF